MRREQRKGDDDRGLNLPDETGRVAQHSVTKENAPRKARILRSKEKNGIAMVEA